MRSWYGFGEGHADGNRDMKNLLGGKGANLAEMSRLGFPVPPGFTLPTSSCTDFYAAGGKLSEAMLTAIDEGIAFVEAQLDGPRLGDPERPLLFSVRSGARVSMPGMMDTVLNLGLTDVSVEALAKSTDNRRFALDSYRRLIVMYADVVKGADRTRMDEPLEAMKKARKARHDSDLTAEDLTEVVARMKAVYAELVGEAFPQDARQQIRDAVSAVFGSWRTHRAQVYRKHNGIPEHWGTAANVQAMVFGNFGDRSGTGVAFTRNPSTGVRKVMGEWLPNAQGEDVVAGIRTPGPLLESEVGSGGAVGSLERSMPEVFSELMGMFEQLEKHYCDMQDVEFTVQEGKLFLLQTRNAKRTARAALESAIEMADEGLIDRKTAVMRVTPAQIDQLMHPQIDPDAPKKLLARGLPASPGAASGKIVLTADEAVRRNELGEKVILVRKETSPEDIHGMVAAVGILTATGGMTSHAAVVARGMGRTCVAGCASLSVDDEKVTVRAAYGEVTLRPGDEITLDGTSGQVYQGIVPTTAAEMSGSFGTLLEWADEIRRLRVRANADTPEDARTAVRLGAEGIGLCRTEHMFFAPERIRAVREMILAATPEARKTAIDKLEPMQREDFVGIFEAMGSRPVTIRFLDPPLHEFLPHTDKEIQEIADDLGVSALELRRKAESLSEFNPMLGHRGCRLGISFPEIYAMQARAVIDAACLVKAKGVDVHPEIMIPLVMVPAELERLRALVVGIADEIIATRKADLVYSVGTMIELPRAALVADEIADHADFFSFGTNDLTQTTLGLSRDDTAKFLPQYIEAGVLANDPFASLDQTGVGQLVKLGTERGRSKKDKLKVGVCGEHGGDPSSIEFFHKVGLDYVSCSPYRVPVARIAAAQAALSD